MPIASAAWPVVCRRIRVRGQVQGVGFRPFVYRLANELHLVGWVRNDAEGVEIEAQGPTRAVDTLQARLAAEAPPLARITGVESREVALSESSAFEIQESIGGAVRTAVTPDSGVCADCLAELFTPQDRRWRYPFINCTHCGPRYTITRGLPYDRPQTSMAPFRQCPACQAEYEAPDNRRFHAQPNACPACGPRLALVDARGSPLAVLDPLAETVARLRRGEILAIKGLGGFHLACDARNEKAVARLRARKNRDEKPFAVMFANTASAAPVAPAVPRAARLLESAQRPIVLLKKGPRCDETLAGVAPGLEWLGAMLPYTPLHYLLFHEAAGRPAGSAWLAEAQPLMLVMTSANPGGEPIVRDNDEALARLQGIADACLMHDRDIVVRCDDTVVRATADASSSLQAAGAGLQFIRRARGFTPQAIALARSGPSVLATGGFLKNTICLTRGNEAFLSQHIGDLDNAATCMAMEEAAQRLMDLLQIEPERVAHDLHPDFHSTRFASEFARQRGLPLVPVQHHHAHVAAVAAEHRAEGPLLGLALDGVGLGEDGGAWGGELLWVDGARFRRVGSLRELRLPGGDRAAREPWRMAAAALHLLGRGDEIGERFGNEAAPTVAQMLEAGFNSPGTSSCGRWFDAAAGLLGIRDIAAYEGQAAMLLEGLADRYGRVDAMADGFVIDRNNVLDLSPLLGWLAGERGGRGDRAELAQDAAYAAARFHATLAEALAQWAIAAAQAADLRRVAFGGGCFLNRIIAGVLRWRLEQAGLEVLEARQAPPNDGGLSLGQAWVAMQV
ncbi:MAG: carbamoyltransferase HypF [Rhodocyclaceae bacterium]